ncbi:MAG: hypothetical protein H6930_16695, partial [Rhodoferax sp.]|nr:hypothetical protein [Rhodoferax sp.]
MPAGALSRCFSAALARALAGVGASLALVAATAAPTASPQPRVVYEMHTARINQIRATPDLTRLITVSQDKTLRVWRVADLALMRSIAVPSEGGEEGALRSLAITPDGREVIVGGWTGLAWTQGQQAQAYRFDLASGQLRQVYRGFPALIESMAISADGRRLAIGLGGGAGLRVLDWSSGRELWADSEYGERVGFADFSVDGTLATTSADGCLRLYTPQGQLVFRAEYPPRQDGGPACRGSALGGVRFSPDGRQLAFGLQDRVEIVVMDVGSRQFRHRLRVDDPGQRSLCCPNWSADGQRLHMHGAYDGDGPTPLYRITLASGQLDRLSVGRQRFTNVLPLPDGELLVSTTTPSLARIGRDGTVLAEKLPPNIDFQFAWDQWRMDRTGARLSLPVDGPGRDRRIFDVGAPPDRAYTVATSTDEAGLEAPSRGAGLAVEAWLDSFGYQRPVRVAGQPLRLKPFQSVRSWASDKLRAALGTQWSVLVADASARIVWEQDLPAPAYQVHLSRDGRFVVAAVGDGSLRWYDAATGTERLGAFLHVNGRDWIAWRPDGFYASSPGGDEYLGWLVNRGDDQEPDLLRAVQFERSLYRPDLLQAALEAPDVPRSNGNGRAPTLAALSAPRVRITSIDAEARKVAFTVHAGGSPVREIGVYADGIPILGGGSRTVGGASGSFSSTVAIPRGLPLDRIRVEAMSSASFGLDEAAALHPQPATTGRGTLWVVA